MFINLNKGGIMNISKTQPKVDKNVSRETQPTGESVWQDVKTIAKG